MEDTLNIQQHLNNKIAVYEEGGSIILDITDDTGGLALKLTLNGSVAYKMGWSLINKSTAAVSRAGDDPQRHTTDEFPNAFRTGE